MPMLHDYSKKITSCYKNLILPVIFFTICFHFQESERIIEIRQTNDGNNGAKLFAVFSTQNVLVRREVLAFPTDSLVADCGGVLGLFLGFNFLMVWEWMLNGFYVLFNRFDK